MKKSILLGINFKNRENKTKNILSISDTDKKLLEKIINCETQKNSTEAILHEHKTLFWKRVIR